MTTSNDKYANIETDVLLGLIERHNTFVILTTNYIGNIDQAFYRRMNYTVEFNKPGEEEREQLWRTLVPDQMPIANDVNYSSLAREYEFTGGDIKNVIIKMATSKANLMEGKPVFDQQDFIKHCEEFYLTNQGGGKNIGFRKS